ncbi:hypothetical protein CEXT_365181 [Caerostris extrusa]|uniref:Uncharacterized protein n=1 Tax=Caerostris extrusa TaxID=172846 RepID=A0AAV4VC84_CAEEX|nr:hypothetical protein CEXT_365181 [Caerostris extrusa]
MDLIYIKTAPDPLNLLTTNVQMQLEMNTAISLMIPKVVLILHLEISLIIIPPSSNILFENNENPISNAFVIISNIQNCTFETCSKPRGEIQCSGYVLS